MSRRIIYSWVSDSNRKKRYQQILNIEGLRFTVKKLMNNLNQCVIEVIKVVPELADQQDEIQEIMENFLFDIGMSLDLTGRIEK